MEVTIKKDIPDWQLASLLCNAFEGGSNYWYVIEGYDEPTEKRAVLDLRDATPEQYEKRNGNPPKIFKHTDYPFCPGGAVKIGDCEGQDKTIYVLDRAAVEKGLRLFATDPKWAHHFANFIGENDDAETGDVFLQLCLFGDVIYG